MAMILALLFLFTGCAIFIGGEDDFHHHRGHWRSHSSLQQPPESPAYNLTMGDMWARRG